MSQLKVADTDWGYRFGVEGTMKLMDACEHFGVPESTMRKWVAERSVRASKKFGRVYVCVKSVLDLMSEGEL